MSPCLFNFYAENIIRNAGMEETQARIKIAGRNINNLRYEDGTNTLAESEEELKSLLMQVKEESEKTGLKLNIHKTKMMASGPITSQQIDGETVETVADYFLGLQNHFKCWVQLWNSKILTRWIESYEQPRQHILKEILLYQQRSIYWRLWFFQLLFMDVRVVL